MKDIIMYGHSGSGNHGCEAIIRSTMKVLQQQCVVYSNSPEQDKKYGINEQCLRQYAKKIKKRRSNPSTLGFEALLRSFS